MQAQDASTPASAPPRAPVSRERQYVMNARIRPLLFWIRKNDVGAARITWRGDRNGAHGYELLVGSDPLKAPRKINRWGYIAEHVAAGRAEVVGVMSQARAESIEDAEKQLAQEGQGGYVFQAIRSNVSGDQSVSEVVLVRSPEDLTFRELDALLARAAAVQAPQRTLRVANAILPGLLSAVAEMVHSTISPLGQNDAKRPRAPAPLPYVYNSRLYDLTMRSLDPVADFSAGDRRYGPALDAEFELLNRSTRNKTKFWVVYGRSGALAGIPLKITLRPRWWFEAELVLAD